MNNDQILQCAKLIKNAKNIFILTGAGMSTESGLPDFRSTQGLFTKMPHTLLSLDNFLENPQEVYDFLKFKLNVTGVKPNIGHEMLAKWEKEGCKIFIATQNIDGLHQEAGSSEVMELHGTAKTASCAMCGKVYPLQEILSKEKGYICECGELIKPDIVLYGELVPNSLKAVLRASYADLLIILGTSLQVHPANQLPYCVEKGTPVIVINQSETMYDKSVTAINIHEGIGETLQAIDKAMRELC